MTAKEIVLAEAERRAEKSSALTFHLGLIVHIAMVEVEQVERFSGTSLHNIYHTHFDLLDGQEWELAMCRKGFGARPEVLSLLRDIQLANDRGDRLRIDGLIQKFAGDLR